MGVGGCGQSVSRPPAWRTPAQSTHTPVTGRLCLEKQILKYKEKRQNLIVDKTIQKSNDKRNCECVRLHPRSCVLSNVFPQNRKPQIDGSATNEIWEVCSIDLSGPIDRSNCSRLIVRLNQHICTHS